MFIKKKLLMKMVEKELTTRKLAYEIGVHASTLSRKINGHSEFLRNEINSICKKLGLSSAEMEDIFFN